MKNTKAPSCIVQTVTTPLLVDADGVGRLLGTSRRSIYNMHQDGTLGPLPLHLGKMVRWRTEELARWVRAGCPDRQRWLEMQKAS